MGALAVRQAEAAGAFGRHGDADALPLLDPPDRRLQPRRERAFQVADRSTVDEDPDRVRIVAVGGLGIEQRLTDPARPVVPRRRLADDRPDRILVARRADDTDVALAR